MENLDAISATFLYAAASGSFEHHDYGFAESVRLRGGTNLFHEGVGCSWPIAPPPRRSGPDHVCGVDEKHHLSVAHPVWSGHPEPLMGPPSSPPP